MKSRSTVSVTELARRCAEEMARYRRRQSYDPHLVRRHCYELFRCALVQRDEEAWAALYSQYHHLVRRWLGNTPGNPDALVNQALAKFWQALPPDRFADFPTLDKILAYLRRCAQSVAMDARRQEEWKRVVEDSLAPTQGGVEQILDKIVGEQLYEYVTESLSSPQERLIFRASFEWNLKPSMIAARWSDTFTGAREVYRIKERIIRRLRRDKGLKQLLGVDDEDSGNNE